MADLAGYWNMLVDFSRTTTNLFVAMNNTLIVGLNVLPTHGYRACIEQPWSDFRPSPLGANEALVDPPLAETENETEAQVGMVLELREFSLHQSRSPRMIGAEMTPQLSAVVPCPTWLFVQSFVFIARICVATIAAPRSDQFARSPRLQVRRPASTPILLPGPLCRSSFGLLNRQINLSSQTIRYPR